MKQRVNLTEARLHQILMEVVQSELDENEVEESWVGDKLNQAKSAIGTFLHKDESDDWKTGFKKAKANWKSQGELNDLNNLKNALVDFIDAGQLNPNMTIAQLVGGKYNNNKFGRLTGMAANRRGQIKRRGGSAY